MTTEQLLHLKNIVDHYGADHQQGILEKSEPF